MLSSRKLMMLGILVFVVFACNNPQKSNNTAETTNDTIQEEIYEAQLSSLNSNITGLETNGMARFVIKDNKMHVTIDVKNAPPGIEHWQHFHGFPEAGKSAECASMNNDTNGDGILDVVETEAVSGTTMVPFNKLPAEMVIPTDTYPIADEDGSYKYEAEIPFENLTKAFSEAFGGTEINLDNRVLYVHGVASDTNLPNTVASIGDIPAHTTLPIACGKIVKVK